MLGSQVRRQSPGEWGGGKREKLSVVRGLAEEIQRNEIILPL